MIDTALTIELWHIVTIVLLPSVPYIAVKAWRASSDASHWRKDVDRRLAALEKPAA